MDPQQEIFTELLIELRQKGYRVFDSPVAPASAKYPFICMGENISNDIANKTAVFGEVMQTIHVWHNDHRKRGELSEMLLNIKRICRSMTKTTNFDLKIDEINQNILTDNTTNIPLLHGVLDITFSFS